MGKSRVEQATGHLWIEEGERREGLIADVAPLIPSFRTYSFAVPAELSDVVQVGHRVMVPIGKRGRLVRGFVAALDRREWDSTLRSIDSVLETVRRLNQKNAQGERHARIHAIGFPTVFILASVRDFTGRRFATLMRILCHENGGTFVALNSIRK